MDLVLIIDDTQKTILCMKINSTVKSHRLASFRVLGLVIESIPIILPRGGRL
jgi:hypothetical protein